jgi:MinD-like ATPase involved in chromosome partitioning or flagellar assembly
VSQFKALEEEAIERFGEGTFNKPECIMKVIERDYPEPYRELLNDFNAFRFRLIINQMHKRDNAALGAHVCRIIEKHMGLHIEFTGNVSYDEHVHDAICQQVSFLDRYPYTKTAGELRAAGRQIFQPTGRQLILQYM